MRAVVFDGPGSVSVRDLPEPEPGPGEVRVRPLLTGVCGTDRHLLAGGFMASFPLVPGHEIVAEVESFGEGAGSLGGARGPSRPGTSSPSTTPRYAVPASTAAADSRSTARVSGPWAATHPGGSPSS